ARDLILAYPTVQPSDAALLARLNQTARVAVVVDDREQLGPLAAAANGSTIPVLIELDVSWRVAGMHLGVRRSPLRDPKAVVPLDCRCRCCRREVSSSAWKAQARCRPRCSCPTAWSCRSARRCFFGPPNRASWPSASTNICWCGAIAWSSARPPTAEWDCHSD